MAIRLLRFQYIKSQHLFCSITFNQAISDIPMRLSTMVEKRAISDLSIEQQQLLCDEFDSLGNPIKLTPFQRKVFGALCHVPEGYVVTYKSLAKYINCDSNQAIGQALKRNPYCPVIPCHRVIKSDGSIGGFHGEISGKHIENKIKLLEQEGVIFSSDGKVTPSCMFDFSIMY